LKRTLLIITDGIGKKPSGPYNAFENANTPTYDRLFAEVPNALVSTHGMAVGLPEGQMGNSEVGHMTLGAGRIFYQDLVKITKAIDDQSIKSLPEMKAIEAHERVHLVGLCSDGGVHSHLTHILGVAKHLASLNKKVFLHLITDGRDVAPTSSPRYIQEVLAVCNDQIQIATIAGRFYTMDRDTRWERVERGYNAMVCASPLSEQSPLDYITEQHQKKITDEFIEPTAFGGYVGMCDEDAVLMMNFRSDRMRQISQLLGNETFTPINVQKRHLHLATMTEYSSDFNFPVLFRKEIPKNTLAEVVSRAGLNQLHTAETEKYAHVTFFFNGGVEEPFENETRVLIPSPQVKTYDEKPEMSANEVGDAVLKAMDEQYDLIIVNFANGDMVGHTGDYDAALKAVECVDENLGRLFKKADEASYNVVLTSDHGNCEEMRDAQGNTLTNHTVGDVFCFVQSKGVKAVKSGGLNHIAPTVLKLMELEIPAEMDAPLI